MSRRHAPAASMVVLVAALAAACAAPPPEPTVTPEPAGTGVLGAEQAQRIVTDTFAAVEEGDAALDSSLLEPRLGAEAITARQAEYTIAGAVAEATPDELPAGTQALYVSGSAGWPRVMAAVSEVPEDGLTPIVYLWVQDSVHEPYTLRGWAHMLPGAAFPAMPGFVSGAAQVPLTEDGVEPSPRQALEDYLEYLRGGADSELASSFAPDAYADQLFAARSALSSAAAEADGNYVDTIQPDIARTFTLSTADGGVMVFAPVQIASSLSVQDASLRLSELDQALLDGSVDDRVTHHYDDLVVLYVPGPGSDALPTVVAAEHRLVDVTSE